MIKHFLRLTIFTLEAIGLVLGAAVGLLFFVFWRAQSGPVDLGWLAPAIETAVLDATNAFDDGDIREISLTQSATAGRYALSVRGLSLKRDGVVVASVEQTTLTFAAKDFLSAHFGPEEIRIADASLRVVRDEERRLNLEYGEFESGETIQSPAAPSGGANVFQNLTGGPYFRRAFKEAVLENARLEFFDVSSGRAWIAPNTDARIFRTSTGYDAIVEGDINPTNAASDGAVSPRVSGNASGREPSNSARLEAMARYNLEADRIESTIALDRAPIGDILNVFLGASADVLSSEVTGRGEIAFTGGGRLLSSKITGRAGAGEIRLGPLQTALSAVDIDMAFDPASNEFSLMQFSILSDDVSGSFSGKAYLSYQDFSDELAAVRFDLSGEEIVVTGAAIGDAPTTASISNLKTSGVYSTQTSALDLKVEQVGLFDSVLSGDLLFELPRAAQDNQQDDAGNGLGVTARLTMSGDLSADELKTVWPEALARAARNFVVRSIPVGRFGDLIADINIARGALAGGGGLTDEMLSLRFKAQGATVYYAPTMAPVENVVGEGVLRGNSFYFTADRGDVRGVKVEKANVEIPRLRPKGYPSVFAFTATGDAGDILDILNDPPLRVLRATPLSSDQFTGPVRIDATITRPNQSQVLAADYGYSAKARFSDVSVYDFLNEAPIEEGAGELVLEKGRMKVTGNALYAGANFDFDWAQKFSGKGDRTNVNVSGVANAAMADVLGAQTRQFLRGEVPFTATVAGNLSGPRLFTVEADLSDTDVAVSLLNWRKPTGVPARGGLSFDRSDPDNVTYDLSINGEGVRVVGGAIIDGDGVLTAANFSDFFLDGAADLSLNFERNADDAPVVTVTGRHLSLAPLFETIFRPREEVSDGRDTQSTPWSRFLEGLTAVGRLDKLTLRRDVFLGDAALDLRHGTDRLDSLDFVSLDGHGHPLSVSLNRTGSDGARQQNIIARTDDIGALLSGVFGITSIEGGQGVIELDFSNAAAAIGRDDAPHENAALRSALTAVGQLEARNIRLVGAPLLARVFAAGSLTGLVDLLNGDGIEISQAFAGFAIDGSTINLKDARAAGPSVGVTGKGTFQLGGGSAVRLNGAVAPAYQLNSFLGRAPLIGDLFVNRTGEGVFALSYDITGDAKEPVVAVNPFSALTPGLLRRMFEPPENTSGPATDPQSDEISNPPNDE